MKTPFKAFPFILAIVALVAFAPTQGCKSRALDPAGVYQSDQTLYNADKVISESYDVMHSFVKFEYQNREALQGTPEVTKAADHVRNNAQQWIRSAIALRDVYATTPTAENGDKLNTAIRILREAINQASAYMAKGVPKK
jgi:hypothetical protein